MTWQPIETAPKTGARIIGAWGNGYVGVLRWVRKSDAWLGDYDIEPEGKPHHWMPLPSPPEGRWSL